MIRIGREIQCLPYAGFLICLNTDATTCSAPSPSLIVSFTRLASWQPGHRDGEYQDLCSPVDT